MRTASIVIAAALLAVLSPSQILAEEPHHNPATQPQKERGGWSPEATDCYLKLRELGDAVYRHAVKNANRLPTSLVDLLPLIKDPTRFICPSQAEHADPPGEDLTAWIKDNSSYVYLPTGDKPALLSKIPGDQWTTTILLHDDLDCPHTLGEKGQRVVVLFIDSHAEMMPIDVARKAIEESRARIEAAREGP